jgi:hypothetical protein
MPKSLASAHSGGSMRFCTTMGGELIRLSWRKCQKVAPSWSGFLGAPRGVVLPSATRPARASWNSLVSRQCRAEFDDAFDLARPGVSLGVRDADGDDDRLSRSGYALLAAQGEVGFSCQDGEAFFLAGMDVLGDHAAGHAAPVEPHQMPVAVGGDGGVLDPLAGGGVEEGPEAGGVAISRMHDHQAFASSGFRGEPGWA